MLYKCMGSVTGEASSLVSFPATQRAVCRCPQGAATLLSLTSLSPLQAQPLLEGQRKLKLLHSSKFSIAWLKHQRGNLITQKFLPVCQMPTTASLLHGLWLEIPNWPTHSFLLRLFQLFQKQRGERERIFHLPTLGQVQCSIPPPSLSQAVLSSSGESFPIISDY